MRSARLSAIRGASGVAGTAALLATLAASLPTLPARARSDIPELESIRVPDSVATRIGELRFFDGVPTDETARLAYDNLDLMRGVEVFLKMLPAVSIQQLRAGNRAIGVKAAHEVALFRERMDSKSLYLTADPEAIYALGFLDLKRDGPTVIEVPPGVLGALQDMWFGSVTEVGLAGADQGSGGRYLALPPGFTGFVPEGYFVVRPATWGMMLVLRVIPEQGDAAPVLAKIEKALRIYPLADSVDRPDMKLVDASGLAYNTVAPDDFAFYAALNRTVQSEPSDSLDPETRGLIASIGIVKGQRFAPDERMKALLSEAAAIANATARALLFRPRDPGVYLDHAGAGGGSGRRSTWVSASADDGVFFLRDGTRNLDARSLFFYAYTGVSPAPLEPDARRGTDSAAALLDSERRPFDGAKRYRLHLPSDVPAADSWSLTLYDSQTRSMLQTHQRFPTLGDRSRELARNEDGSIDVWFGPTPPESAKENWLETVPGKSWFTILRLHGALAPWSERTWSPGEIELVP